MNKIKLLVLDVDGVLTDGKLYYGTDGMEYKSFHTKDGLGINLARHSGMKIVLITGRKSNAVSKRAEELRIDQVYQDVHDKVQILNEVLTSFNLSLGDVCYMGDDLNDLPVLQRVGYAAAPQNAVPLVKQACQYVTKANGGEGAVRELIDHLLSDGYDYPALLEDYFNGLIKFTQ